MQLKLQEPARNFTPKWILDATEDHLNYKDWYARSVCLSLRFEIHSFETWDRYSFLNPVDRRERVALSADGWRGSGQSSLQSLHVAAQEILGRDLPSGRARVLQGPAQGLGSPPRWLERSVRQQGVFANSARATVVWKWTEIHMREL